MTGITDDVDEHVRVNDAGDVVFSFPTVSRDHGLTTSTLLQRLLLLAVTDLRGENTGYDPADELVTQLRERSNDLRELTVSVQLNGLPVPSRRFFTMLSRWMQSIAEKTAYEAFGTIDGLADLRELIAEATVDLQARVDRLLRDAGIEGDRDDR